MTVAAICATTSSERIRSRGVALWLARRMSDNRTPEDAGAEMFPRMSVACRQKADVEGANRLAGMNFGRLVSLCSDSLWRVLKVRRAGPLAAAVPATAINAVSASDWRMRR